MPDSPTEGTIGDEVPGTEGYPEVAEAVPVDTEEYPESDKEDPWPLDLERYMDPKEVARRRMLATDQPIAHDGKGGWAVEISSGRAVWITGETQWEVMAREPGTPRDEPGLTDVPRQGGPPKSPASTLGLPAQGSDLPDALAYEKKRSKSRVQIGLKLTLEQGEDLVRAADLFGVPRTTLARLLVVRGAREILGGASGGHSEGGSP